MRTVIPEGIEYIDAPLIPSKFHKHINPDTNELKINVAILFNDLNPDPVEYEPLADRIEEYLVDCSNGILSGIYLSVVGAIVDDDHSGYVIVQVIADATDWVTEYLAELEEIDE